MHNIMNTIKFLIKLNKSHNVTILITACHWINSTFNFMNFKGKTHRKGCFRYIHYINFNTSWPLPIYSVIFLLFLQEQSIIHQWWSHCTMMYAQGCTMFSSSCNLWLQWCQPCEPIREQISNPSAIWLDGTVLALASGSCNNLEICCTVRVVCIT